MTHTGWLTPHEVADQTGYTVRTIQRWCRERRIPHVRVGRLLRFTPAQLAEIEAAYTIEPDRECVSANRLRNPEYRESVTVVPMRRPA